MTITIYLVRHGEAAAGWGEDPDPGLSEKGRIEASTTAGWLSNAKPAPAAIISSPMRRAQETAAPLVASAGVPLLIDSVFTEIPSPVPIAHRRDWLKQMMTQKWMAQPPDIVAWREAILERLLGLQQDTAVFTHFMVINAVVGVLQQREETLCFLPANGSVTTVSCRDQQLRLESLGAEKASLVN